MSELAAPPVVVEKAGKVFRLPREQITTLKERMLHPFKRSRIEELQALHDVTFAVRRGEFFGIVGRNGSGKSTLLKCIAGIYGLDRGAIYIDGRLSTFIELGVGFNPDLPARDNIMLNATMLGLSPSEARKRCDRILDFAELHDFVDLKLKNYSSGMMVRLAFSVMIQVDADILLIDEILAVGDAAFQQKCYDEFARLRRAGTTVLFVTHDMAAVERFCDRTILLERGRAVALGAPAEVARRYLELNFSEEARREEAARALAQDSAEQTEDRERIGELNQSSAAAENAPSEQTPPPRYGDQKAEIVDAWFEDDQNRRCELLHAGNTAVVVLRVCFKELVQDPLFGINIHNTQGLHVFSASNLTTNPRCGQFRAGQEVVVRITFPALLAPDRYLVTPAVAHQGGAWIDRREHLLSIVVAGSRQSDGVLQLPYQVSIEPLGAAAGVELTL